MKVKINSCSDRLYWYKEMIGFTVNVERESQDVYWARENNEYYCLNFILKKDATVVNEQHNTQVDKLV